MSSPTHERSRALDGLRGVAVLAVVLFHLGFSVVPGGLLGVDVFFVLSGFLITGLLLGEWARTGGISLRTFWVRRWRRLLPALLLMLVVVTLLVQWVADPAEVPGVRRDALATLFYVANWHAVASGQSYFDVVAPSPLRHTWTLGVEEQFYLLWPLLAIVALTRFRSSRLLLGMAVFGAAASAGLMLGLALAGVGTDRLYYGTDTRVQALLVGAALATVLHRRGLPRPQVDRPRPARLLQAGGALGAFGLLVLIARADGQAGWLYRGGFTLVAVLTGLVVAAVVVGPGGLLARLLAVRPLAYLGRISYGVYLWHWPVVVLLTPARVGFGGVGLAVLRAALTLLISAASFHLVEQPIRRFGLPLPTRPTRPAWATHATVRRIAVPTVVAAVVAAVAAALVVVPVPRHATSLAAFRQVAPAAPPAAPPDPIPAPGLRRLLAPAVSGARPVRVMLVGDSVAFSLGLGLEPAVDPTRVTFTNQGYFGCGVARGTPRGWEQPPACLGWPARWQHLVDRFRPDVTLLLPSVWDTYDRQRDGRWQHVGEPAFDSYLRSEFDLAMRILTSRSGRVAVLEAPCNDRTLANGTGKDRLPPDDKSRLAQLTALLGQVVARYPSVTQTLPFDELICPHGTFQLTRDGHPLRQADGIHLEAYAGDLFARSLLPPLLDWTRMPIYAP